MDQPKILIKSFFARSGLFLFARIMQTGTILLILWLYSNRLPRDLYGSYQKIFVLAGVCTTLLGLGLPALIASLPGKDLGISVRSLWQKTRTIYLLTALGIAAFIAISLPFFTYGLRALIIGHCIGTAMYLVREIMLIRKGLDKPVFIGNLVYTFLYAGLHIAMTATSVFSLSTLLLLIVALTGCRLAFTQLLLSRSASAADPADPQSSPSTQIRSSSNAAASHPPDALSIRTDAFIGQPHDLSLHTEAFIDQPHDLTLRTEAILDLPNDLDPRPAQAPPVAVYSDRPQIRQWAFLSLNTALDALSLNIDNFFLLWLLPSAAFAAYFNGAYEIPLTGLLISVAGTFINVQIRQYALDNTRILELFHNVSILLSFVLFPLFFFLQCYAGPLFDRLLSGRYADSVPVFEVAIWIIPCRIAHYTAILQHQQRTHIIVIGTLVGLLGKLILCPLLFHYLSIRGVAAAMVIATATQMIYYLRHTASGLHQPVRHILPFIRLFIFFLVAGILAWTTARLTVNAPVIGRLIIGCIILILSAGIPFIAFYRRLSGND